jgi:fibronectin-binding autotransporter adhesin
VAANPLTLQGTSPTVTVNALGTGSIATISASLAGTNGLTKAGSGILLLSGSNNYSGGTLVSAGALRVASSFALGTDAVTVSAGAGLQLQNTITIANSVNLNGASALSLISGTTTFSGTVSLQSASTIALGTTANTGIVINGDLNLGNNTLTASGNRPLFLNGAILGSGTLNLANINGTTSITNDNSSTFSGAIAISRSTVAVGNDGALGTGTIIFGVNDQASGIRSTDTTERTLSNVLTLVGNGNSTYNFGSTTPGLDGNLTFADTTAISLGASSKRFQVHNRTVFAAGFAGSTGIIMQTGTGTLVLNGVSTYTGATTVNAGTLLVNGSISSTTGGVTVAAAGTLGGGGTITGATALNGILTPGEDGIADELTFGSSLDVSGITSGIGALKFDLGTTSDMVTLTSGVLAIGNGLLEWDDFSFTALAGFAPGTYILFSTDQAISGSLGANLSGTIGSFEGTLSLSLDGTDVVLTVVPEPAASALIGAGLMTALFLRRRQRQS